MATGRITIQPAEISISLHDPPYHQQRSCHPDLSYRNDPFARQDRRYTSFTAYQDLIMRKSRFHSLGQ